ncbi:GNAT family N-acetyltransferase [Scytonema sp. PRP1]|uniref:GNAT family N-acetyltransferase n=1 Tax=Scytonema sp. PRP1 TaxID=3120513 RepID=UPI002FD51DA8
MKFPPFAYVVEPLDAQHNRSDFECGVEPLDRYLKQQASQDMRRRIAALFVLVDQDIDSIAGYYTLAATAIRLAELPPEITKKLPKYPLVPATLLGRLAVDQRYQGQGIGSFLLMDALRRSFNSEIASMAVVVDAKDDKARDFYEHHQFIPFSEQSQRLYLSMTTIAKLFGSST